MTKISHRSVFQILFIVSILKFTLAMPPKRSKFRSSKHPDHRNEETEHQNEFSQPNASKQKSHSNTQPLFREPVLFLDEYGNNFENEFDEEVADYIEEPLPAYLVAKNAEILRSLMVDFLFDARDVGKDKKSGDFIARVDFS